MKAHKGPPPLQQAYDLIDAREVEGKPGDIGVVTFVDNGITYLEEFDTANTRFIVQNPPNAQK